MQRKQSLPVRPSRPSFFFVTGAEYMIVIYESIYFPAAAVLTHAIVVFSVHKPCYRGPGELKTQPSTHFKIIDNAEQRTNLLKLEACPSSPRLQLEPAFGHMFQR